MDSGQNYPGSEAFVFGPLKTRDTPKQARAKQRVDDILNGAVRILASHPPDHLSANTIAKEAGIPVSSIYRYFPTVQLLIDELYLQAADTLKAEAERLISGEGAWQDRLVNVLVLIRDFLDGHPYYQPLLVLIAAHRGPQTLKHDFNAEIVSFLADRWRKGEDGFIGPDPDAVAATALQLALSFEELMMMQAEPEKASAIFAEVSRVMEAYMAPYFKS